MPDFFEEVKAAVVDDAALSQEDTSQGDCSVSRELIPGPQPRGGTSGSSCYRRRQHLEPSAWSPAVLPEPALPCPRQHLCSHCCPPARAPSASPP